MFRERATLDPTVPPNLKLLETRAPSSRGTPVFSRKDCDSESLVSSHNTKCTSEDGVLEEQPADFIEPIDILELKIQDLRAYATLDKNYLDHGEADIQEEAQELLREGYTQTRELSSEHQDYLRLAFPVYSESQLESSNQNSALLVKKAVIPTDFDDDCATDDEMVDNAKNMINKEL